MWPHDGARRESVIRIGARALELWGAAGRGLELLAAQPLPRRGSLYDAQPLADALGALNARVGRSRTVLVLESAYVPVLLVDTGGALASTSRLEALLRHRFDRAYGGPGSDIAGWRLRTPHRFGRRHALACAVPGAVDAALRDGLRALDAKIVAWVPALSWSLDRFDPCRAWSRRGGWWLWREQDRALLAHLTTGGVQALNPAVRIDGSGTAARRAIAVEATRAGIEGVPLPTGIGSWTQEEWLEDGAPGDRFVVEAADTATPSMHGPTPPGPAAARP